MLKSQKKSAHVKVGFCHCDAMHIYLKISKFQKNISFAASDLVCFFFLIMIHTKSDKRVYLFCVANVTFLFNYNDFFSQCYLYSNPI